MDSKIEKLKEQTKREIDCISAFVDSLLSGAYTLNGAMVGIDHETIEQIKNTTDTAYRESLKLEELKKFLAALESAE